MPGGGTPALAPINCPGLLCGFTNASLADAADQEKASTPAAANRALAFKAMVFSPLTAPHSSPGSPAVRGLGRESCSQGVQDAFFVTERLRCVAKTAIYKRHATLGLNRFLESVAMGR